MDQRLERILPRVQKPARYTGGEYRQIIKDKAEVDLRLAFCLTVFRVCLLLRGKHFCIFGTHRKQP